MDSRISPWIAPIFGGRVLHRGDSQRSGFTPAPGHPHLLSGRSVMPSPQLRSPGLLAVRVYRATISFCKRTAVKPRRLPLPVHAQYAFLSNPKFHFMELRSNSCRGQGPRRLTVGGKAAVAFFLMEIQVGKEGGGARSTPPLVKLRQLRAAGVKIADPVRVAEFPGMINGSFGTPTPGTRPHRYLAKFSEFFVC